jgi:hypothetical protein
LVTSFILRFLLLIQTSDVVCVLESVHVLTRRTQELSRRPSASTWWNRVEVSGARAKAGGSSRQERDLDVVDESEFWRAMGVDAKGQKRLR